MALLPNGENAHCTVKPVFWYYHLFEKYFPSMTVLKGSESYLNTFLTFPVKPDLIKRYEDIIKGHDDFIKKCEDSLKQHDNFIKKLEDSIQKMEASLQSILSFRQKTKKLNLRNKLYYKLWKHLDKKLRKKGIIS